MTARDEADNANQAADDLWMWDSVVIFYDLEGYSDSSCRNESDAFIQGWTDRLSELDYLSGVYGSACGSYMEDFADNNPAPDQMWFADWDGNPNVYEVSCVDSDYWIYNQRFKQYKGLMSTHTEILPSRSMMIAQMADQHLMPEQRIRLKMPIASESNVKTQNAIAQLAG